MYVENYELKTAGRLVIGLINNTPDTLLNQYKVRDRSIVWLELSGFRPDRKLLPGDTLRVYTVWHSKSGKFAAPLVFNYSLHGSPMQSVFRIWGNHKTELQPVTALPKTVLASQKTYYPNGFIRTEIDRANEYHYSEKVSGQLTKHLIGDSMHTSRLVIDYEHGEMRRKTAPKRINYQQYKIPYTVSEGTFAANELVDGIIHFYNVEDELVVSVLVQNGVQQEGFIYKGERCNLTNSEGQKEGKWISLLGRRGYCTHYSIADYACKFVRDVETYRKGVPVDTAFSYYKSGKLLHMTLFPGDFTKRNTTSYREDGTVMHTVSYFKSDTSRFTYEVMTHFSESGCITSKTLGKRNGTEDFNYTYGNCKLQAKISFRKEFFDDTTQILVKQYIPEIEGPGKEIFVTQKQGLMTRSIPYTIEKGEFDAAELYLISGTIEYRDKRGAFLRSRKVVNGMILEEE